MRLLPPLNARGGCIAAPIWQVEGGSANPATQPAQPGSPSTQHKPPGMHYPPSPTHSSPAYPLPPHLRPVIDLKGPGRLALHCQAPQQEAEGNRSQLHACNTTQEHGKSALTICRYRQQQPTELSRGCQEGSGKSSQVAGTLDKPREGLLGGPRCTDSERRAAGHLEQLSMPLCSSNCSSLGATTPP